MAAPIQLLTHTVTNITGNGTGDVSPFDSSTVQGNTGSGRNDSALANAAGTLARLRVRLDTAPGAGTSRLFVLRVNDADTALTVTISGTNLTAEDTSNSIAIAVGDKVALRQTASNSPAAPGDGSTVTLEWTATDGQTQLFGGAADHSDAETSYRGWPAAAVGGAGSFTLAAVQNVLPLAGTMTGMRVRQVGTNTVTFTVVVDGVEQDGTGGTVDTVVTTTGVGLTASKAFTLPLTASDLVAIKTVCGAGIFGSTSIWGTSFVPTTAAQVPRCGANYEAASGTAVRYHYVGGSAGSAGWTTVEANRRRDGGLTAATIKHLYVKVPAAPGAGKSYTFDLLKNGASVAGCPTVTISDTSTTGFDTTSAGVLVTSGDTVTVRSTPSGSPADVDPALGWVEVVVPGIYPSAGSLFYTGFVPLLALSNQFYPSVGSVLFSGFAPQLRLPTGQQQIDSFLIELELDGVWTNVTSDLSYEVLWRYGNWGAAPLDRVAQVGVLYFGLRNGDDNSAGLLGYYSPGHANVRAGFERGIRVRATITYLGVAYRRFTGKLYEISPTPGEHGDRWTRIVAFDWMDELASFVVREVTGQTNKRADQLITTLVAAMPTNAQPVLTSYDVGVDTFPIAFDDLQDGANGLSVASAIALSELGFIYVKGDGTLRFENRQTQQSTSITATFDNDMTDLAVPGSLDHVYNHVRVTIHPKETGVSTIVLWAKSPDVAPAVPASSSITVFGNYRDPTNETTTVGGTGMVTPVATTDYVANTQPDGSGTNITADITITATFYGSSFKYVIANANAATAYMTTLQARGTPIYDLAPITVESESAQDYGRRTLELDMPYQDDENVAQDIAVYLRAQYQSLVGQATSIRFNANRSFTHMNAALSLEPGAVITVSESVTGLSAINLRVSGVELMFQGPQVLWCQLATTPAFITDAFILDDPDFGELDDDKLGFL